MGWRDNIRPLVRLEKGKNYVIFEDDGEEWTARDGRRGVVFKVKSVEMKQTGSGLEPGKVSDGLALITTSFRMMSALRAFPTMVTGKIWSIEVIGDGMDKQFKIEPL